MTTTALIMSDLAENLVVYGLNVNVICAQPTYLVKKRCPKHEVKNGVEIRRVCSFLLDKNKILGRVLNSTSCFLSMMFEIMRMNKKELIILNTNPAMLPCLGFLLFCLDHRKYAVLIHDLWPELPAHTGIIKKNGFLYKIIDLLNTLSLKYAACIVVLSDAMKKVVLQKVPGHGDKIHVIPNWADETFVYPVAKERNILLDEYQLRGKKIVMYSGNLGRYQPLEVMIHSAEYLQDRDDIIFLFIGDGAKKKKLQEIVQAKGLRNVKFFPFQQKERLAESLSMADVSLMGIMPQNEGVIMPSKLYGLLAVGRPIICVSDPHSEVVTILRKAGAGIHTDIDDPAELASNIKAIIDTPQKAHEMGENGRRYFLDHFERKKITLQWKEVLESFSNP